MVAQKKLQHSAEEGNNNAREDAACQNFAAGGKETSEHKRHCSWIVVVPAGRLILRIYKTIAWFNITSDI
ncbi:hypothetical protein D3C71_1289190 [compost metagenome]